MLSSHPGHLYRAGMALFRMPFCPSVLINDTDLIRIVLRDRQEDFPKSMRLARGCASCWRGRCLSCGGRGLRGLSHLSAGVAAGDANGLPPAAGLAAPGSRAACARPSGGWSPRWPRRDGSPSPGAGARRSGHQDHDDARSDGRPSLQRRRNGRSGGDRHSGRHETSASAMAWGINFCPEIPRGAGQGADRGARLPCRPGPPRILPTFRNSPSPETYCATRCRFTRRCR